MEEELRKGLSLPALAFEAPWVMEGLPAEQTAAMIGSVPMVLQVLYYVALPPSISPYRCHPRGGVEVSQVHTDRMLDLETIVDTAARFITTEYSSLTAKALRSHGQSRPTGRQRFPAGSGLACAWIAVQGLATVRDRDRCDQQPLCPVSRGGSPRRTTRCRQDHAALTGTGPGCGSRSRRLECCGGRTATSPGHRNNGSRRKVRTPSDPPPSGRGAGSWSPANVDWRVRTDGVSRTRSTGVDRRRRQRLPDAAEGPLSEERCRRVRRSCLLRGSKVRPGPAFLSFHTHAEQFDGQENVGLAGTASLGKLPRGETEVRVRVDRALADFGVPRNKVRNALHLMKAGRQLHPRLQAEAARRGTTVPRFDELRC